MLILIAPMYSKQELNGDSIYVVYSILIRALEQIRPNWQYLVLFPDNKSGFKYDEDGFFRRPNITRIAQRISPRKMANTVTFDGMYFDRLYREYGIDVVWCDLTEIAGALKRAGSNSYDSKGLPTVIAAHNYVIHPSLPHPYETLEHAALAQMAGSYFADWNVFNSEYTKTMVKDVADRFLLPELVQSIMDHSSVILSGPIETKRYAQFQRPDNEIPVIAFNHRLQTYKNYLTTFGILNELYSEGVKFRMRFIANTTEYLSRVSCYPWADIRLCATREDYERELSVCDLNTTNSQIESFGFSIVESMGMGQAVVVPNALTFPELLPAGYPFLFNSVQEQKDHLRSLLTDRILREEWGAKAKVLALCYLNSDRWAESVAALIDSFQPNWTVNSPDDVRRMVLGELNEASGCTLKELYNRVTNNEVNGRVPFGPQSLSMCKLSRLVRQLGGRVVVENSIQRAYKGGLK